MHKSTFKMEGNILRQEPSVSPHNYTHLNVLQYTHKEIYFYFESRALQRKVRVCVRWWWVGGDHSQEFWCLLLCRYAAKGSVYVRHCNTELRKQVFPRFCRPAPWNHLNQCWATWITFKPNLGKKKWKFEAEPNLSKE